MEICTGAKHLFSLVVVFLCRVPHEMNVINQTKRTYGKMTWCSRTEGRFVVWLECLGWKSTLFCHLDTSQHSLKAVVSQEWWAACPLLMFCLFILPDTQRALLTAQPVPEINQHRNQFVSVRELPMRVVREREKVQRRREWGRKRPGEMGRSAAWLMLALQTVREPSCAALAYALWATLRSESPKKKG